MKHWVQTCDPEAQTVRHMTSNSEFHERHVQNDKVASSAYAGHFVTYSSRQYSRNSQETMCFYSYFADFEYAIMYKDCVSELKG